MPSCVVPAGFPRDDGGRGGAALVAACSSPKPGEVAKDGSVTVKHIFGETKIPAPPKRVVSAGFTEQDDLLAVGVVPIAVTDWFGGEPFGVWPWAQPKLGGAQPVVLNLNDGIQVDQIASLKPDLIVATNAGLDQDTYTKLSAIAPTIAQSGPDAFFEPWKDQATAIGQAVFKADDMAKLIAAVDEKFASVGKNNPQFAGKKVLLLGGTFYEDNVRVTTPGWRTDFLTKMGFTIPDTGGGVGAAREDGVGPRRRRRADLDAPRATTSRPRCLPIRSSQSCGRQFSSAMCSPARISPARSRSRRRCPTRWSPTSCRR